MLRPDKVEEGWARAAVTREAGTLESLGHPFIVRAFRSDPDGPRPHLVLEHLDGPSLHSVLRDRDRLSLDELLPLTLHLCSALHYLASRDVVHLDLKPRNIVMGSQPRLIDFSLARVGDAMARVSVPTGTSAYMAPEQCLPDPALISPQTDVWGLGIVIYEALSGRLPFPEPPDDETHEMSVVERFPQLAAEARPLDPDVPDALARMVMACFDRDPRHRPRPSEIVLALEPMIARLRQPVPGRRRLLFL